MRRTVRRIVGVSLATPAAMGQRLSRAKAPNAQAGSPLALPGPAEAAARAEAVPGAVCAAHTIGAARGGADAGQLAGEAPWRASLAARLAPRAYGLLALIHLTQGRRDAGRAPDGTSVPQADRAPRVQHASMLADAEAALHRDGRMGRPGRFRIEASIRAVHAARRRMGRTG